MPSTRHLHRAGPASPGSSGRNRGGAQLVSSPAGRRETLAKASGMHDVGSTTRRAKKEKASTSACRSKSATHSAVSKATATNSDDKQVQIVTKNRGITVEEPRRSKRQRTVSKRLENMEVNFGGMKGKRTQTDKNENAPETKKRRQISAHISSKPVKVKEREQSCSKTKLQDVELAAVNETITMQLAKTCCDVQEEMERNAMENIQKDVKVKDTIANNSKPKEDSPKIVSSVPMKYIAKQVNDENKNNKGQAVSDFPLSHDEDSHVVSDLSLMVIGSPDSSLRYQNSKDHTNTMSATVAVAEENVSTTPNNSTKVKQAKISNSTTISHMSEKPGMTSFVSAEQLFTENKTIVPMAGEVDIAIKNTDDTVTSIAKEPAQNTTSKMSTTESSVESLPIAEGSNSISLNDVARMTSLSKDFNSTETNVSDEPVLSVKVPTNAHTEKSSSASETSVTTPTEASCLTDSNCTSNNPMSSSTHSTGNSTIINIISSTDSIPSTKTTTPPKIESQAVSLPATRFDAIKTKSTSSETQVIQIGNMGKTMALISTNTIKSKTVKGCSAGLKSILNFASKPSCEVLSQTKDILAYSEKQVSRGETSLTHQNAVALDSQIKSKEDGKKISFSTPEGSKIKIVSLNSPPTVLPLDVHLESDSKPNIQSLGSESDLHPVKSENSTRTREQIVRLEDGTELTLLYQAHDGITGNEAFNVKSDKQSIPVEQNVISIVPETSVISFNEDTGISPLAEQDKDCGTKEENHLSSPLGLTEDATSLAGSIPAQGSQLNKEILAAVADAVKVASEGEELAFLIQGEGPVPLELSQAQDIVGQTKVSAHKLVENTIVHRIATDGSPVVDTENIQQFAGAKVMHLDMILDEDDDEEVDQTSYRQIRGNDLAPTLLGEDTYGCPLCSYMTAKKANWYKHKKKHILGQRTYPCNLCDSVFKSSSNLKRHLLIHSGIKDFECTHCGQKFRQKVQLVRHISYRHQPKTVKCEYCDYTCASYNPDLKIHLQRRHLFQTDEEKAREAYTCEECGFLAVCARDLKQHQKFHKAGPELKFFCEKCSFVTDCESRLKRHQVTHTKERPFSCSLCDYRGSQKEHVLRHMHVKHKMDIVRPRARLKENVQGGNVGEGSSSQEVIYMTAAEVECSQDEVTAVDDNSVDVSLKQEAEQAVDSQNASEKSFDSDQVKTEECDVTVEENEVICNVDDTDCSQTEEDGSDIVSQPVKCVGKTSEDEGNIAHLDDHESEPAHREQDEDDLDSLTEGNSSGGVEPKKVPDAVVSTTTSSSSPGFMPSKNRSKLTELRKMYAPVSYTPREKVFSCLHCTMKFAKLISLYKHLKVQHVDLMTCNPEGFYSCVICDYRTTKRNNLLVHMRKHSNREGTEIGVQQVYSCIVCNYNNPRRTALQQHMRRCHDMKIVLSGSGQTSCLMLNPGTGTNSEEDQASQVLQQVATGAASLSTASSGMITVTGDGSTVSAVCENYPSSSGQEYSNVAEHGSQLNQVQVTGPDGSLQTVVVEMDPITSQQEVSELPAIDMSAADAIEGLQALAEQVSNPKESDANTEEAEGGGEGLQISPEELMKLSSGDIIEINGEMYKVEFATE